MNRLVRLLGWLVCDSLSRVTSLAIRGANRVVDKYITAKRDPQWHADQQQFIRYRDEDAA